MDFIKTTYDKHKRIWSGSKKELLYDFDCSVGKIIYTALKTYPKNVCQISDPMGRIVTNKEALTWAIRIAQRFKKMGLRHDDVIGIVAKNSTFVLPVGVACFMNCTPFHAINPILDKTTIKHLFELTKPKVIFCDGDVYEKVYSVTKSLKPLIYTLVDHIADVPRVEDLLEPTQTEMFYRPESLVLGGEQTMAILCSSGTTGLPKAICISNYHFMHDSLNISSEDFIYNSSGLDWLSGVQFLIMCTTMGCTRIITDRPYSAEYFVELVRKYKITFAAIAPRHVATLIACPSATSESLASLRSLIVAGGYVSVSSLQRLQSILKRASISFGYGMSEIGGVSLNFGLENCTSVGKLMPGISVRIVDENGKNLGPNEVGEIYVHSGHKWNGYYGNPLETQRLQDSLGWIHTGDLGYFDEKYFLTVVDRKKDILKYQGMQYWPGEIEQVIMELPDVVDVCVVGIYDESCGDAAGAVVVKTAGSTLAEKDIKEHVLKRLPVPYKQLHAGVRFVDKLPQNENGKTLKKEVKALLEERKV